MPSTRRKNKRDSSTISGESQSSHHHDTRANTSPPKRKIKALKTSRSSKKKQSTIADTNNDKHNNPCLLLCLLNQIDTLSLSKSKAVAAIQSISKATIIQTAYQNSKSSHHDNEKQANHTTTRSGSSARASAGTPSNKKDNKNKIIIAENSDAQMNANIIIITTHIINRILIQLNHLSSLSSTTTSSTSDKEKKHANEQKRQYSMVLSIYASRLTKILLADKSQLERTINSTSYTTTSSPGGSGHSSDNKEEEFHPRSVLSRAILSSMLAILKSMSILSTTDLNCIPSEHGIYAKLMWMNANSLETLLGLGSNYRLVRGGSTSKGNKSSSSASASLSNTKSTLLSTSIISTSGGIIGGGEGNDVHSSIMNDDVSTVSVHNMNMSARRANEWNEICAAMDKESANYFMNDTARGKSGTGSGKASSSLYADATAKPLTQNKELLEALKAIDMCLFDSSSSTDLQDGEALLNLITFDHSVNKKNDQTDSSKGDDTIPIKQPTKKRRTEISTATATRTRSKTLSDKKWNISNEYTTLSARVSDLLFSRNYNTAVFGGNRFNLKKWSSSAFTWTCNGQSICLEMLRNMFMSNSNNERKTWDDAMKVVTMLIDTSTTRKKGVKGSSSAECKRASSVPAKSKDIVLNIPGNLVLLTYASRVIDIINEGGKLGASSLQRNGGVDYAKLIEEIPIAPPSTSQSIISTNKSQRQPTRKNKESSKTVVSIDGIQADTVLSSGSKGESQNGSSKRSDIRNLSIMVMELLLIAHQKCMDTNVAEEAHLGSLEEAFKTVEFTPKFPLIEGEKLLQVLLNEEDDAVDEKFSLFSKESKEDLMAKTRYLPLLHKTLDTLINCATSASMSVGNIDDCASRLTGIGAALALKYSYVVKRISSKETKQEKKGRDHYGDINTVVVVDAKLCSWAIHHFSATLANIIASAKQTTEDFIENKNYSQESTDIIDEFLLREPLSLSQVQESGSHHQQYVGLFARVGESQGTQRKLNRFDNDNQILALFMRASIGGDASGEAFVNDLIHSILRIVMCCYSVHTRSNVSAFSKINTYTRFTLAADCVDVLLKCFALNPSKKLLLTCESPSCLHDLIRKLSFISPQVICTIVELGHLLEQNVIQHRVKIFGESCEPQNQEVKSIPLASNSSLRLEFEHWERRLWSSHVKLCLVISRGATSFDTATQEENYASYLGPFTNKIAIFRAVAIICNDNHNGDSKWPLYLPSIHHSLITSSLISDPVPKTTEDAAAEQFVCKTMLSSINDVLTKQYSIIIKRKEIKKANIQISDEEVLFSLRDARLFVISLSRLPKEEQKTVMSKLLSILSSHLSMVKKGSKMEKIITTEKDCSSFLARVVTVMSIILDFIAVGQPLLNSLATHVSSLHYYLPSMIEVDTASDIEENDWYRSESCFMGLWEEWESSALPSVEIDNTFEQIPSDELKTFRSILEGTMEIGFDSAPADRGHLLFASWNASSKLCYFDSKTWEGPSTAQTFMKESVAAQLITIRDDLCNLINGLEPGKTKSEADSLLSKLMKKKQLENPSLNGQTMMTKCIPHLKSALLANNEMLRNLLRDNVCTSVHSPTSSTFALIEARVAYTSFLMAMFTTSGTDILSAIMPRDERIHRKRKGSSISGDSYDEDASEDSAETDGGYNDDDDDYDEIKSDGISRFHDICEELGAAPMHPDWLDVGCRLRAGISKSSALESSEVVLSTLTALGTKVYERFLMATNKIMCLESEAKIDTPIAILLGMIHDNNSTGWAECVADVFDLDANMMGLFEAGVPCKNLNGVKEAWAPNSAHRVRGKLQNTMSVSGLALSGPELRAGSEWEILLSDSLLGACSDVDYSCDIEMRNTFQDLLRWSRLLHAIVSTMVTATALLQFSLNNGNGRSRHDIRDRHSSQMCRERWFQNTKMPHFPSQADFSSMKISSAALEHTLSKSLCFLSDIYACGALPLECQLSAQAALGHLVGDKIDFQLLTGQKQVRNLISGLNNLADCVSGKEDTCAQSANGIIEKLFCSDRCLSGSHYFQSMLLCLGSPIDLTIATVLKPRTSLKSILRCDHEVSILPWQWGLKKVKTFEALVLILQGNFPVEVSGKARLQIISIVREMLSIEYKSDLNDSTVKKCVLNFWNKASVNDWKEVVLRDICLRDVEMFTSQDVHATKVSIHISRHLCYAIALLLGSEENAISSKAIFDILLCNTRTLLMKPELDHVLYLLFLSSICLGSIEDVGRTLLSLVEDNYKDERSISILEMFYKYLCESRKILKESSDRKEMKGGVNSENINKDATALDAKLDKNRRCTFVSTHGEYTEQHWYNCYTCGLIWDKGCCSLCAQVCHKGHDVGYSRKSSFYCDCGAPGESDNDCQRVSCKSLVTISEEIHASLEGDIFKEKHGNSGKIDLGDIFDEFDYFWNEVTEIISCTIPGTFQSSLDGFIASQSEISEKLSDVFNAKFESLTGKENLAPQGSDNEVNHVEEICNNFFTNRIGNAIEFRMLEDQMFSCIRTFKASSLCTRISNENSTDRLKKSIVTKNSIERNILVADRRGRIIIYEPSTLLFCAGFSIANVRHKLNTEANHYQRSDLCVLGASKIKCHAVGLSLHPEDDSRLAAWGISDAFIYFISEAGDKVEYAIELDVGLGIYDCEADYIVKVEWVMGSSCNTIVVFCATSVKIFNLSNVTTCAGGEFQCQPRKVFSFGYEDVVLRSGTIIPITYASSAQDIDKPSIDAKIALIFDTGRLHFIDLTVDRDGNVDIEGNARILGGDGFSFPIGGIRRCSTSTKVEAPGETTKSLGAGAHLQYLHQSNLLLYKCTSSPVIALTLDESGQINGSFEFLPHVFNKEWLGTMGSENNVTGPYNHIVELGTVYRDGSKYFRLSFTCRSTRMNQSKMMYMEYNDEGSTICEIKSTTRNLSLALNTTFEGTAAFITPILGSSKDGMAMSSNGSNYTFSDRIIIVSVVSNGSVIVFGEASDIPATVMQRNDSLLSQRRQRAFSDSIITSKKEIVPATTVPVMKNEEPKIQAPRFPLTIFEHLINLSESPELIFGGDAVKDPDITKRRLSVNSGECIISPCKDGCTLTVSLRDQGTSTTNDFPKLSNEEARSPITNHDKKNENEAGEKKLAIVAVRILLGSTNTDYLPGQLAVMGRQIKLAQRMKRWYDVPLTDEEIMLASICGTVTISVGSSFESSKSPPIIDSIEMYALERDKLPHLFSSRSDNEPSTQSQWEKDRKSLDVSILTITHLCNLLGKTVDLSSQISQRTLRRLIQVTALDASGEGSVRDHVVELVKSVEKDSLVMQMILDEGTLQGVSQSLNDLLCASKEFLPSKIGCLSKTRDCLNVALTIARDRPANYKSCQDKLISSKEISKSITLQVKEVLDTKKLIDVELSTKLIQLCIFEFVALDGSLDNHFTSLELVTEMLRCKDERTVKESCAKLAETLKELQTLGKVQAYKCDGCEVFPITNTRYTLEDKNIDLCEKCFGSGNKFAGDHNFASNVPALINGTQLIMENKKVMSCSHISQMTTKLVPPNICEQLEETIVGSGNLEDEEEALTKAIKMSMELPADGSSELESQKTISNSVHIALLIKLLEELEQALLKEKKAHIYYPVPIVDLLLTLVVQSDMEDRETFGRLICESCCSNIYFLCERFLGKEMDKMPQHRIRYAIMIYLRAIEGLATKKQSILGMISKSTTISQEQTKPAPIAAVRSSNKDKTDPRFVCEAHGVPAVRRRCSHGENKDRRFYVCGMDRKNRCKYFRWADEEANLTTVVSEVPTATPPKNNNGSYDMIKENIPNDCRKLQTIIWDIFNDKKKPLQQRLCTLLQVLSKKLESQKQDVGVSGDIVNEKITLLRRRIQNNKRRINNYLLVHGEYNSILEDSRQENASEYSVIESTLDLLSKVAMNELKKTLRPQSSWESWFELLCEIISSNPSAYLRSQARTMMRKLCGGRNAIYQQIRDQYVFGFQFMKLLNNSIMPLEAALDAREKARKCGPQWRFTDLSWATLPNGGLIGTQQLISEDNYAVVTMDRLSKVLDDVILIAESRSTNWKHFCSLDKLPQRSHLHSDFCDRSPICLLFWMACSLPSPNQVKVFKLMDIAFGSMDSKPIATLIQEDSTCNISVDGGTDGDRTDVDNQNEQILEKVSPQQVLLNGASALTLNDIHAFVISFILNGDDDSSRKIASNICLKMLVSIPKEWIDLLLGRFLVVLVSCNGYYGCKALEFLQFLFRFVSNNEIMVDIDTSAMFKAVTSYYTQQLKSWRDIFLSFGKESSIIMVPESNGGSNGKNTTFDLSTCLHCCRSASTDKMKVSEQSTETHPTASSMSEDIQRNMGDTNSERSKRRLDNCTLNSVSTEFSCYSQLKSRMTITEINLSVSDQRGRFVKKIGVYFTPRPVQDVNELKHPNYLHLWQRCGTFSLTRGGTRGTCKFTCPVVAANLKFEYEEFYDKNASRPSSTSGHVIHCPRCTRVVNATHGGVCGNCGEVVFQCRKCRHINYDRLDAFLCVECGYCSSGSFTYDIAATPASIAVAITDDEGLDRAVRLMWLAGNKYNECKAALLKSPLQATNSLLGCKRLRGDLESSVNELNDPLKRALLGDLPKINVKKQEGSSNPKKKQRTINNNADPACHGDLTSVSGSSAVNRARSLLNLAIQLRSESTGINDRANIGGVPDSLSRLVANIARERSVHDSNNRTSSINEDARQIRTKSGDVSEKSSLKKMLQTCDKLYSQMRSAEVEIHELRTRVIAWKRLNNDALAEHGRNTLLTNCPYTVSSCSSCSPLILKHLLALIHVLFQKLGENMTTSSLNKDFISSLFDEVNDDDVYMSDLKREMIIALASKSELGADMILKELKSRLQASKSPDCADILGHLLSVKGIKSHQKFVEFAMQTLQ